MSISIGHNGWLKYIAESTPGAGLPASGVLQVPGDGIISAEIVPTMNKEHHYNIDDYDAWDTSYHSREFVLNLSYKLQQVNTTGSHQFAVCLENYAINRTSGDLTSVAFVMKTNAAGHYLIKGGKCNTSSFENALNSAIIVTEEWWGTTLTPAKLPTTFTNYSSLTQPVACGGAVEIYGGGAITKSGKWSNGVKSATLTIGNQLERVPKLGSQDMVGIYPGTIQIGLKADILSTAGGSTDIADLLTPDEVSIILASGTTASKSHKFTLSKPSYTTAPVTYRADTTHYVTPADITAESLTYAAYS